MPKKTTMADLVGKLRSSLARGKSDAVVVVEVHPHNPKEPKMALPQPVLDALAAIRDALSHLTDAAAAAAQQKAADQQVIDGLNGQVTDLQSQLDACKAADVAKDAQIAELQADLTDLQNQVTALAAQLNPAPAPAPAPAPDPAPAPAPAPADGSGSGDVTA